MHYTSLTCRLYTIQIKSFFLFIQKTNLIDRVESSIPCPHADSIPRDRSDTSYEADALPPSHHGRIQVSL